MIKAETLRVSYQEVHCTSPSVTRGTESLSSDET